MGDKWKDNPKWWNRMKSVLNHNVREVTDTKYLYTKFTLVCKNWGSKKYYYQMSTKIRFVLFGIYSPFTTWATLGSHPDLEPCMLFGIVGPRLLFYKWTTIGSHSLCPGRVRVRFIPQVASLAEVAHIRVSWDAIQVWSDKYNLYPNIKWNPK